MKRFSLALVLGALFTFACAAQEGPAAAPATRGEVADRGDPWIWWKWVNFLMLAGALGYLVKKNAGPYFASRTVEIERGIADAAKTKREADARAAEIDRRMSGLAGEIDKLRQEARAEMSAEGERLRLDSERQLKKIEEQSQQELALIARAARHELKTYTAGLALGLAEDRIRASLTHEAQNGLVDAFIRDLRGGDNRSANA